MTRSRKLGVFLSIVALLLSGCLDHHLFLTDPHYPLVEEEILLDVPHLWAEDGECALAALAMVAGYYQDFIPMPKHIDAQNDWLSARKPIYAPEVIALAKDFWEFEYAVRTGATLSEHHAELMQGRPTLMVIPGSPGYAHMLVVVGISDDGFLVHDPGGLPFEEVSFDQVWDWMRIMRGAAFFIRDE
jgi:hypothetical protein